MFKWTSQWILWISTRPICSRMEDGREKRQLKTYFRYIFFRFSTHPPPPGSGDLPDRCIQRATWDKLIEAVKPPPSSLRIPPSTLALWVRPPSAPMALLPSAAARFTLPATTTSQPTGWHPPEPPAEYYPITTCTELTYRMLRNLQWDGRSWPRAYVGSYGNNIIALPSEVCSKVSPLWFSRQFFKDTGTLDISSQRRNFLCLHSPVTLAPRYLCTRIFARRVLWNDAIFSKAEKMSFSFS